MTTQEQESTWVDELKIQYVQLIVNQRSVKSSFQDNITKPICDTYSQIPLTEWSNRYYKPLEKQYHESPRELAEFKQCIVQSGNENYRLLFLGLVSLSTVFALRRFQPGILNLVRNSVISYYGYGLILAPEVYNPFLVQN